MKSAKFIACCFVEVPNDDIFCNYEFKDSTGTVHSVVGKRGDWLYITDGDRIFTKNQLFRIKSENNHSPVAAIYAMNMHSNMWLESDAVNKARCLPGAEF
ncbi:hypothetical protein [Escherichia coli]|uniref:hypothetical protein n=1 Tax=Escherichia coli TaxID=562 RepID=UPI000BE1915F|nr:hypothetical protein [Escherichia coli]